MFSHSYEALSFKEYVYLYIIFKVDFSWKHRDSHLWTEENPMQRQITKSRDTNSTQTAYRWLSALGGQKIREIDLADRTNPLQKASRCQRIQSLEQCHLPVVPADRTVTQFVLAALNKFKAKQMSLVTLFTFKLKSWSVSAVKAYKATARFEVVDLRSNGTSTRTKLAGNIPSEEPIDPLYHSSFTWDIKTILSPSCRNDDTLLITKIERIKHGERIFGNLSPVNLNQTIL